MNFLVLAETLAASENEIQSPLPIARIAKTRVFGNFGNFGKRQGEELRQSEDTIILAAIRTGNVRHGPIATATGLGATHTYQTIDCMLNELSGAYENPDTDAFEERAAIVEYDGGLSRADAEQLAAECQGYDNVVAFRVALKTVKR